VLLIASKERQAGSLPYEETAHTEPTPSCAT
jgi:hypothetical protein